MHSVNGGAQSAHRARHRHNRYNPFIRWNQTLPHLPSHHPDHQIYHTRISHHNHHHRYNQHSLPITLIIPIMLLVTHVSVVLIATTTTHASVIRVAWVVLVVRPGRWSARLHMVQSAQSAHSRARAAGGVVVGIVPPSAHDRGDTTHAAQELGSELTGWLGGVGRLAWFVGAGWLGGRDKDGFRDSNNCADFNAPLQTGPPVLTVMVAPHYATTPPMQIVSITLIVRLILRLSQNETASFGYAERDERTACGTFIGRSSCLNSTRCPDANHCVNCTYDEAGFNSTYLSC